MPSQWVSKFSYVFGGWLVAGLLVLLILQLWDPGFYFIIAFTGFILATEYSEPREARPEWHKRLRWITLLSLLIFAYIVVLWIEEAIGVAIF